MEKGRYGIHGGQYIPETLMNEIHKVERRMNIIRMMRVFKKNSISY